MVHRQELLLEENQKLFNKEILISYSGPFDKFIIARLGEKVKMLTSGDSTISKRIFRVFMELAQNVYYYSARKSKLADEKNTGMGALIIGESDDYYIFGTANPVKNENIDIITQKCDIINSLEREKLRRLKRDQLALIPGTRVKPHFGLIMVALISSRPLDIEFTAIDQEYSNFSIFVRIDKYIQFTDGIRK